MSGRIRRSVRVCTGAAWSAFSMPHDVVAAMKRSVDVAAGLPLKCRGLGGAGGRLPVEVPAGTGPRTAAPLRLQQRRTDFPSASRVFHHLASPRHLADPTRLAARAPRGPVAHPAVARRSWNTDRAYCPLITKIQSLLLALFT